MSTTRYDFGFSGGRHFDLNDAWPPQSPSVAEETMPCFGSGTPCQEMWSSDPSIASAAFVNEMTSKEIGGEGEQIAAAYLLRNGYQIMEKNWHCPYGEADIIALQDDVHVLVEVKTRLDSNGQSDAIPELAVDRKKQERYRRIALDYLVRHHSVRNIRFDVIAINIVGDHAAHLRHLLGAFEAVES